MKIGIDIRPLLDPIKSGVPLYTQHFLDAIFTTDNPLNSPLCVRGGKGGLNQYFLFYNVWNKNLKKNLPNWNQDNVHFRHFHYPNKLFNFSVRFLQYPKFDKLLKDDKINLFYFPNLIFSSVSMNCPKIVTCHDLSFEINSEWFSQKSRLWHQFFIGVKRFFKNADRIIAVSENTKRDLIDFYKIPEEKIKVIYPGVTTPHFVISSPDDSRNEKSHLPAGRYVKGSQDDPRHSWIPENFILYLGTIEPRKNILGVIKAFERWKNNSASTKDYHLILAGARGWAADNNFWRNFNKEISSINNVKYLGPVSEEEKFTLYRSAKLFLYPSFYEGFGFPPLEAMSCETPVIASCNSSFPEVLGDAAFLINPYNINDIVNGIETILSNDNLREQLVQKGLKRIKKFSWQKAAKEWLNLVNSV